MFFCFTCGVQTFTNALKGYENRVVQCQNCGNMSGRVVSRWQWFTFCFIPIIPFSIKPWHEVGCHICNFYQDVKYRPDITGDANYPMQPGKPGQPGQPGPPGGPAYK